MKQFLTFDTRLHLLVGKPELFFLNLPLSPSEISLRNFMGYPHQVRKTAPSPRKFSDWQVPGSSTELRPQQNTDYVSPMILQYMDSPQGTYQNRGLDNMTSLHQQHSLDSQYVPRGSTSAPAHIAFRTSPFNHLPSPTDLDFDISPLTSPWLGAHQQTMPPRQSSHKRTASPSGDESITPSRKRQSPAIRPTNPTIIAKRATRCSKSTNSTPLLRSTRPHRKDSTGDGVGDTPSPVDLTMPPPAPPSNQFSSSASSSSASLDKRATPSSLNAHLTPVTPASIMNLGRLGINSSLAPPARDSNPSRVDTKGKGITRPKLNTEAPVRGKPPKKSPAGALLSPSLKAILPGPCGALFSTIL